MAPNIIQVDIGPLDSEIASIRGQIAELEDTLKLKLELRKYITELGIGGTYSNGNGGGKALSVDFIPAFVIPPSVSVSEFIKLYLKKTHESNPNAVIETNDVIKAYSSHVGKPIDKIRNNIYNALSRLKDVEWKAETIKGKGTSAWRLINKKEHA